MKPKIKIVLSGSGMRYPVHAGAVARIRKTYDIEEIAGVSGGAIIAGMVAVGMTDNQIREWVVGFIPKDHWRLFDLSFCPWWSLGFLKGVRIFKVLEGVFKWANLKDTNIPLHIGTTSLDTRQTRTFSSHDDPETKVADAVRASICFPLALVPWEIEGVKYIDGGVTANFPLDIFGTGTNVVGVKVIGESGAKPLRGFLDYLGAIFTMVFDAVDRKYIEDAVFARFVRVKVSQSSANVLLSSYEAMTMWQTGWDAMDTWLETAQTGTGLK